MLFGVYVPNTLTVTLVFLAAFVPLALKLTGAGRPSADGKIRVDKESTEAVSFSLRAA